MQYENNEKSDIVTRTQLNRANPKTKFDLTFHTSLYTVQAGRISGLTFLGQLEIQDDFGIGTDQPKFSYTYSMF